MSENKEQQTVKLNIESVDLGLRGRASKDFNKKTDPEKLAYILGEIAKAEAEAEASIEKASKYSKLLREKGKDLIKEAIANLENEMKKYTDNVHITEGFEKEIKEYKKLL